MILLIMMSININKDKSVDFTCKSSNDSLISCINIMTNSHLIVPITKEGLIQMKAEHFGKLVKHYDKELLFKVEIFLS